jgi:hypothetical protein
MGRIASHYYLSYRTVEMFAQQLTRDTNVIDLLRIMTVLVVDLLFVIYLFISGSTRIR